ncbi:A24 family peptidase [uncultured Litoreibacter sp.]|uniref:prepilin peptidase n=1 Tax=uncultured Litoreibacter sp. TaxID=1392394 RepID=UPI002639A330|nr:A24 family peptidase [uncultured Litoreibacter sp.]
MASAFSQLQSHGNSFLMQIRCRRQPPVLSISNGNHGSADHAADNGMGRDVDWTLFAAIFVVLISPAIGSFLGVLVDRLPRGEDVVRKPSTCRNCGTGLAATDLVPVASYAILRGKCRTCHSEIPAWHFYIEIAAIGLGVIAALATGNVVAVVASAAFLWLLLGLAVADAVWYRLPDLMTAGLLVAGFTIAWADPQRTIINAVIGSAVGCGGFWALRGAYRQIRGREGLGLGDVKLMAGIGAGIGPMALPALLLLASLAGLVLAATRASHTKIPLKGTNKLPFGAFLSLSAMVIWFVMTVLPNISIMLALR